MAIREGRWDCTTCGSVGNLGHDRICPNCGNPRSEGVRFYLPEDEPTIQDPARLKAAQAGADWLCEYCGSSNAAQDAACNQCGAAKGAARSQQAPTFAVDQTPRSGDNTSHQPTPPLPIARPARWRKVLAGCFLVFAFLVIILGYLIFRTRELTVTVVGLRWERSIALEKYGPITEEDWSVPEGGRILSQRREVHHVNHILDHYERRTREVSEEEQTGTRTYVCGHKDLGNGNFEDVECTEPVYETRTHTETYQDPVYRDDPVYQTKYRYEINKWTPSRSPASSGTAGTPSWPAVTAASNERETGRTEKNTVLFKDEDGDDYALEFPLDQWQSFSPGQKLHAKQHGVGGKLELSPK